MPGKGNVKFCYVCAKDLGNRTNLNRHMEKHATNLRFSNMKTDYNKTACKICGKQFLLGVMRSHTQKFHKMTIREYKNKFQEHFFTLEDPIFHRCGVCQAILLLDSDSIATHIKKEGTHGMTHKDYNRKFIKLAHDTQSKENMKSKRSKNAELCRQNSDSANLFSAKSTDNPCKGKENKNKVISCLKTKDYITVTHLDKEKLEGTVLDCPSSSDTQTEGTEHLNMDDGIFDIASFREFQMFLGNEEEGVNTSYPTIEAILMMDTSSS